MNNPIKILGINSSRLVLSLSSFLGGSSPVTKGFRKVAKMFFKNVDFGEIEQITQDIQCHILILTPMLNDPLEAEEMVAVKNFVKNGGTLLLHAYNFDYIHLILREFSKEITISKFEGGTEVNDINSPILRGSMGIVKTISVFHQSGLYVNDPNAVVLVGSRDNATLVELKFGSGTVIMFTNFTLFNTNFVNDDDNDVLISNILDSVSQRSLPRRSWSRSYRSYQIH